MFWATCDECEEESAMFMDSIAVKDWIDNHNCEDEEYTDEDDED